MSNLNDLNSRTHTLFRARNAQEVYALYQTLSEAFLKKFKCQAEFRISAITTSADICLNVQDASEEERKWLEDSVFELSQKKLKK
mgnify:CR=1 FL=1